MTWTDLFERAGDHDVTEAAVSEALRRRREERNGDDRGDDGAIDSGGLPDVDPMVRIVADADVLVADLLVGGSSREALDLARSHGWVAFLASEPLLADAAAVIADLAADSLATEWREGVADLVTLVEHPAGDHPALATAMRGEARHVLSLDPDLGSVGAGVAIRREANVETSVRSPEAFARLFDPERIYEAIFDESYDGER